MKKNIALFVLIGSLLASSFSIFSFEKKVDAATTKSRALSDLDTTGTIFDSPSSQAVKNYYSAVQTGDSGESLILKLETITKSNQTKIDYSSGKKGGSSWNGYYLYERDYSLSPLTQSEIDTGKYATTNIWMTVMYSTSPIFLNSYINNSSFKYYSDWNIEEHKGSKETSGSFGGSAQFDREHVFPKSYGFNGSNDLYKDLVAGCDAHNLHAAEHVGNSSGHNSLPYGNVVDKSLSTSSKYTSGLTGETVGYTGYNSKGHKVFEPLDKDKGNIARSCFYMAARYHTFGIDIDDSTKKSPALTLSNNVEDSKTTVTPESTENDPCAYGELDELLEWNKSDPVDDEEIRRNDLIYNSIQLNRNPFVDFPSWADACFGSGSVSYKDINIRHRYLGEAEEEFPDDPTPTPSEVKGFTKFTSVSDLKVGNKVVFGNFHTSDKKYYTMSKTQNTNNRGIVESTLTDNICTPAKETEIFTIVEGTIDNTIGFKTEDGKYIYAAGSADKNNYLRTKTTLDANGSFLPSLVDNKIRLTAQGSNTHNILLFNQGSKLFSCYLLSSASTSIRDADIFGYTPDSFAEIKPEVNLSFSFKDNGETFSDFCSVSINIRFNYNFVTRSEPYSAAKIIVEKDGDIYDYSRENYYSSSFDETGKIAYSWKDYSKDSYSLSITNIPARAYMTQMLIVGYVSNGGVCYFSTPVVYSVYTLLQRYSGDDSMIEYTNKDKSKTSIKVSDIAKAFIAEIEGPGEE